MKVTVVGAGAVGATCADNIARKELCHELVLLDIKEGLAEGKAQDMMQTATFLGFDTHIVGSTNDYSKTAGSDVVVITSGIPRKPGMTREELIGTNAGIVKGVCENILKYSPNAVIIVISNPMDTMTYLALTSTGLPKNRIIGMGGTLDSSRFKYQLSQHLNCSPADLNAVVVGGHGDTTMIPLIRLATWNSVPVTKFLSAEQQTKIVNDTMVGGATLTKLIGTSAWYAPGASGAAPASSGSPGLGFVIASHQYQARDVAAAIDLPREYWKSFNEILQGLWRAYESNDATLAEINPLIITGDNSPALAQAARAAGIELMRKPVKPAELRALLAHLLA
jgi:malate dehydrogenase